MVAENSPELGVDASLYPVVGRRERAGLREPGVEVGEERPRRDQRGQRPPRLPEPLVGVDPPPVDERGVLEEVGLEAAPQVEVDPLVEGYGVAVATGLPVASHARLHQQPLALVVIIGRDLSRQRGTRAHDARPFCQDENARQDGDFAQVERIAGNFDGAFRAAWDALESRNSAWPQTRGAHRSPLCLMPKSSHWDPFPNGTILHKGH